MKKYLYMLGSAIAFVVAMSACGHSSDGGSNATTATACTANAAGCVYSNQYGWITQGSCQTGQGWYNNACISLNGAGGYYGNNGYYGNGYYGNTQYYPQTGLYATPYYTYPVMYGGGGYYGGGYYGGGCRYRTYAGGLLYSTVCY